MNRAARGPREQVKLVVWDLDETIWRGVLAEGPVEVFPGRVELLGGLVDRGVMVSVSSRNDLATAREELERLGLWELVIFPRINWEAKGAQVRDLIEAAQLRPPNVLFVDDNHLNREEASFFAPGLQVADPADPAFDHLLAAVMAAGRRDPGRRRLAEYRLLENRTAAAEGFGDNREFLRSCNIEVRLTERPAADVDRLAELVARTNQLNYTKRRVDREAVGRMLADPGVRSVAVRVRDRFGDYGLVGFAAVAGDRVEQLAFSCRILGMGVERAVYDWLGRPVIEVAEPVSAPLEGGSPDWLRIVEASDDADRSDARNAAPTSAPAGVAPTAAGVAPAPAAGSPAAPSARRVLFVGGCDLESVLPFLPDPDAAARHFNYSPAELPRLIVHRDSIDYLLADDLPESTRAAILADAPFLDAAALEPPDWAGVREVVYSPLIDYVQAKFARPDLPGVYVSFGDVQQPDLDATRIAHLAERYGLNPRRLERFAGRWHLVRKPDEVWRDQLRRLFARIREDAHLTVLLGATDAFGLDPDRVETHRHHNALVSAVAGEFRNVSTLAVDPLLHGREDFTNSIRHYSRRVYHDIAVELGSRLGPASPPPSAARDDRPPTADAERSAAPKRKDVSAARRLLRRGLRRLRGATRARERA